MPEITFYYIFITAFITSLIMVPYISNLAVRIGGMDRPNERKIHSREIPRLGGIAIFFAFILAIVLYCKFDTELKGILAGAIIIFLVGLADDLATLTPNKKLLGQFIAAAVVVIIGNVRLTSIGDPFGLGDIELGFMSIPFSLFALIGVMNAINLHDGLDGLAGGVSAIACIVFGTLAYKTNNQNLLCLITALLGAIFGFLNYNTFPAKIFMGDAGSLLLGYCMGVFSINLVSNSNDLVSPYVPLIVLAVPILDTLVVMTNRLLKGNSLFSPDKSHIHHRLLDLGIGHKFTVIVVYGITYALGTFSVLSQRLEDYCLVAGIIVTFVTIYTCVNYFSRHGFLEKSNLFLSNQSIRETSIYQSIMEFSPSILFLIKYLLLTILVISIFIPKDTGDVSTIIFGCLIAMLVLFFFMVTDCGDKLLQGVLYLSGILIIFQMENLGRETTLLGFQLLAISNILFITLLAMIGFKIFLRRNAEIFTASSLEYFVFFIALCIPLLPGQLTSKYHLLTVAGKSTILFFAYKMILMREIRRNRKILFVTFLALFTVLLRHFTG